MTGKMSRGQGAWLTVPKVVMTFYPPAGRRRKNDRTRGGGSRGDVRRARENQPGISSRATRWDGCSCHFEFRLL